jgi:hypothetical protein
MSVGRFLDEMFAAEQAAHRREQAISFAFGQVALADPDNHLTREQVAEVYERLLAERR